MPQSELLSLLLGPVGLVVGMILFIVAIYKEVIVTGASYRRALARIDKQDALIERTGKEKDRLSDALVALTVSTKIMAEIEQARQIADASPGISR